MKKSYRIIYQDEALLAVDKPDGLLVVPAPRQVKRDLTRILNDELMSEGGKVYPCHRLDKETSGVVLFARGKSGQKKVMDEFRARQVKKLYIGFVRGRFGPAGKLTTPVAPAWPYSGRGAAKPALTRFHALYQSSGFSVVLFEPVTGRTNQIRLQVGEAGHPLLGERRFARGKDWPIKFRRAALHALYLEIRHPLTNKIISFRTALPRDMELFLAERGLTDKVDLKWKM